MTSRPVSLPAYAVFAALLAAAGLPIYIHAPKFYVDDYGVSLAALGAVLFGLRLFDVVQDPLLGRLAGALRQWRASSGDRGRDPDGRLDARTVRRRPADRPADLVRPDADGRVLGLQLSDNLFLRAGRADGGPPWWRRPFAPGPLA